MVHLYRNEFKPRDFVWIDHGEKDGLSNMFCSSMPVDEYNMPAPHCHIRVEHDDRVECDKIHKIIRLNVIGFIK